MTATLHALLRELTLGKIECPDLGPRPDGRPREKDLFRSAGDALKFNGIMNKLYSTSITMRAYACSCCEGFHLTSRLGDCIPTRPFSIPRQNNRRAWTGKRRDKKRRTRRRIKLAKKRSL